jgi:hypothetical protein
VPKGDDLVKSVYCSVARFTHADEKAAYEIQLKVISATVKNGGEILYPEPEMEKLRAQLATVESVTWSGVLGFLLRLFAPAFLFLGLLYCLLYFLRK